MNMPYNEGIDVYLAKNGFVYKERVKPQNPSIFVVSRFMLEL